MRAHADRLDYGLNVLSEPLPPGASPDEFAETGITSAQDIEAIFTRQYFAGCEADDPMNAVAFRGGLYPNGAHLGAVFSSDIGHWDVPDVRLPVVEAYELVTRGLLDEAAFEEFVFGNAARLWGDAFFAGTSVEGATRKYLAGLGATGKTG
jgi:hypothetical protein